MNEKTTKVFITVKDYYSNDLNTYIAELIAIRDSAPEEYRGSVVMDVEAIESYGDIDITRKCYYLRPENAEECEIRNQMNKNKQANKRSNEILQLKILKLKYPND